MADESYADELRVKIKEAGVSKVAKAADVPATTLYSYLKRDTRFLRGDTERKVEEALIEMGLLDADNDLKTIIDFWASIPNARRKILAQTAKEMAEPKVVNFTGKK
ncbi:MAG: hypothetical protein AAFO91_09895 [Bacteroidota bacterium]